MLLARNVVSEVVANCIALVFVVYDPSRTKTIVAKLGLNRAYARFFFLYDISYSGQHKKMEEAKDKVERDENERIEKLKEDLKTKSNFYPSSLMKRVYVNASEAKRGSGERSDKNEGGKCGKNVTDTNLRQKNASRGIEGEEEKRSKGTDVNRNTKRKENDFVIPKNMNKIQKT